MATEVCCPEKLAVLIEHRMSQWNPDWLRRALRELWPILCVSKMTNAKKPRKPKRRKGTR